ncbi:uncharacterized protein LOC142342306 isoform X2 [Convolutriloba macropyga]|uniref:uncharacterized protein LOC142342306 isoform X2 n=1 Tax=Convolutriloba macropyga TaxID=536237 RepID=UPI003F5265BB
MAVPTQIMVLGIVAMFAIRGSDTIASNNVLEHKISQGHPFYPRIRKSTTRNTFTISYNLKIIPAFHHGPKMVDLMREQKSQTREPMWKEERTFTSDNPDVKFKPCHPCTSVCPVTSNICSDKFQTSISDWTTFTLGNLTEGNSEYWSGNWKFAVLDYENMNEFGLFRFSIPSFEVLNQPDLLQSVGYIVEGESPNMTFNWLLILSCLLTSVSSS